MSNMKVAVIFGWIASTRSQVAKYAPIYLDKGYYTVETNMPIAVGWVPFLAKRQSVGIADELDRLAIQARMQKQELDVVFHMFSLAANAFLPGMLATMSKPDTKWRLRAIVHDSGPVGFGVEPGVAAANIMLEEGAMSKVKHQAVVSMGKALDGVFGSTHRASMAKLSQSPLTAVPQLFLYSRRDRVAPWKDVQRFMKEQAERGVDVSSHCWKDSLHVKHFRQYPSEYKALVGGFLDKHVR